MSKVSNLKSRPNRQIVQAVKEHTILRDKIKELGEQIRVQKDIIRSYMYETKQGICEISGMAVSLTIQEREYFDLKRAQSVLPEKVLAPFIKVTEVEVLNVQNVKKA